MNKKNIKLKITVAVILLFFVVFSGSIFYISGKISPDEIRKSLLATLTKTFPQSEFILEEIDYSFGLSLKFTAKKFEIITKRKDQNEVLKINDANVYIPFWAILTGGGGIEINVERPEIYYYAYSKDENNFKTAFKMNSSSGVDSLDDSKKIAEQNNQEDSAPSDDKNIKVLNFFAKSNINIKFTDILIKYQLEDRSTGNIKFDRFLVKNLNFVGPTAFEVATDVDVNLSNGNNVSLNTLLIGDVNLNEVLQNQDLKTSLRLTVEKLRYGDVIKQFPIVNSDLKVQIAKANGKININLNTEILSVGHIKTLVDIDGEKISVAGLDILIDIKELLNATGQKIEMVNPNNSKFTLSGAVDIEKGKISPKINFALKPGIIVNTEKNINLENEIKGSYDVSDLELTTISKLLKGSIETKINTKLNINNIVTELDKIAPIFISVNVNDLALEESFIHDSIYKKADGNAKDENENKVVNESNTTAVASKNLPEKSSAESPAPILPRVNLDLNWKNILIGKNSSSGASKILVSGNKVVSDNFTFNFSKGKGKISFVLNLLKNDGKSATLNFNLDGLDLEALKPFMPPQLDVITGTFSGKVNGNTVIGNQPIKHNFDVELSARNGEIKGIKIGPMIQSVADNFSFTKGKASGFDKTISNNFETFYLKGNFQEIKYFLESFKFVGINKAVEINGKGIVYPPVSSSAPKSEVEVNVLDNTGVLSATLEKQAGTKVLPILLTGTGFGLMPDYLYTTKKLAKGVVSQNKEKVTTKVKEEAKKKIEEIMKDENKKEKIKGMLKGLF